MLAISELNQCFIIVWHHGKSQNIIEKSWKIYGILLPGVCMNPVLSTHKIFLN